MQGDPENDTGSVGVQKRPDADTYAERRSPHGAADRRVFDRQRGDRVHRGEPGADLRVDRAAAGAQEFSGKSRKQRGAIRRYASKVTGLSLPQITRLIRSYTQTGTVELRVSRRCRFPGKYTERDVTLLAEVDRAHERFSGPAT
jgi:hypothetical protein